MFFFFLTTILMRWEFIFFEGSFTWGYPEVASFAFIVVFVITFITIGLGGELSCRKFWVLFSPSWFVVFGNYKDHVAVALIWSLTSLLFVIQFIL